MRSRIDPDAFEALVREHHAAAYRAALRLTRDPALALDAVQEVYLQLLRGRLDPGRAADLGRLLRCAAARAAAMRLRSEHARTRRETEVAMPESQRNGSQVSEEREVRVALDGCVEELPEELRQAIVLRFREGLGLAEIGDILGLSEPGVHGRLERGLERLRVRLGRLGFAAFVPRLSELLPNEAPAYVPPEVAARLLTLGQGALATALLLPLAACALVGLGLAVALSGASPEEELASGPALEQVPASIVELASSAEVGPRAPVRSASASAPRAPAGNAGASALWPDGVIEGEVRDEFGLAVEGAEVTASTIERDGKFASASRSARSTRDGRFQLAVPVAVETGQDYALAVVLPSLVQEAGRLRVRPGATAAFQRIRLFAAAVDRPGSWALELELRGPSGEALDAVAQVHGIVRHSSGSSWSQWQAGGTSDLHGHLRLEGEGLGSKLLVVDARRAGFAPWRGRIELDTAGTQRQRVVLEPGRSIVGTILDEHGAPAVARRLGAPHGTPLHCTGSDRGEWFGAEFPEPGRFEIPALGPGPHELHFRAEHWSSFTLHDVFAGAEPLRVRLKLAHDPNDEGLHDAEIHGTLRDAASGEPVALERTWTWIDRIEDDSPALLDGDFAPLLMERVVVQTCEGMSLDEDAPPPPPPNALYLGGLEAGRYVVRVRAQGYAPALIGPLELGPRSMSVGHDLRLARGAVVEGRVVDEAGQPLAGALVLALGSGELSRRRVEQLDAELVSTAGRGTLHTGGARTDADGRFVLTEVPTGAGLHLVALHCEHAPEHGARLELAEGGKTSAPELRFRQRRER